MAIVLRELYSGEGRNQTVQGVLDTTSESTDSQRLDISSWYPHQSGGDEAKVVQILVKVWVIGGPLSLQIHPVVISLVPRCTTRIDKMGRWCHLPLSP